jgi:N-acetylmuramoyl-L-alanine amidase
MDLSTVKVFQQPASCRSKESILLAGRLWVWHDRTMKLGCFFGLALAFLLTVQAYSADWDLVSRDGREYVTVKSFCDFYHFPYPGIPSGESMRLKNAQCSLVLKLDSRDIYVNGVRYWLSFGVRTGKDDWLVSRVDLVKLFEPLLRPYQIDGRRPVVGVVIDPGHGGSDNGANSSRGVMEKNLTLDTAMRLEKLLRDAGFKTVMTRRSDVFIDLYERAQRPSAYNGYIFVSLHYNSAGADARGLETYACSPRGAGSTMAGGTVTRADYQKVPGNDCDNLNILLASEVHRNVVTLNPGDLDADRGVKRARFVVLRQNTVPAVLVEGGFLSHRMESSALATPAYRQKLAEAVARGISSYAAFMLPPEKRVTAPQVRPPTPAPSAPAKTETAKPEPSKPATATASTSTSSSTKVSKPAPSTATASSAPASPTATASSPAKPAETAPSSPKKDKSSEKPSENKPAESKPSEAKPSESKPEENTPSTPPAGEEKPAEKPAEKTAPAEPETHTTIYPDQPESSTSTSSSPTAPATSTETQP